MEDFILIFEENGFTSKSDNVWSSARYGSWRSFKKMRFSKEYEKGRLITFEVTDYENFQYSINVCTRELLLPLRAKAKVNTLTFDSYDDFFKNSNNWSVPMTLKNQHEYMFALDANFTFMDVLVAPSSSINQYSDFLTVNKISENIQNMDVPLAISTIRNEFYNRYCYHDRVYWNPLTGVLFPCF